MKQASIHSPMANVSLHTIRRWTLITLVGSVVGLGLIGIGLLIFSYDPVSVYRVSGTVGVLAAASALTLIMVALAEKRLIGVWYLWSTLLGVIGFSTLSLVSIWWDYWLDRWKAIGSGMCFVATTTLATPVAMALRSGRTRIGGCAGLGVVGLAFAWSLGDIWLDLPRHLSSLWSLADELVGPLWILACVPTHASLVVSIDADRSPPALRWATIIAGGATGVVAAAVALFDGFQSDEGARLTAILAIAATCLTILTAVVSRMRAARTRASVGAAIPIELTCPACRSNQVLHAGESACANCGCAFSIRITPRSCMKCGYTLAGLRTRECPECGTAF